MAIEDFTTYIEEDDNNKLTVTSSKAEGADVDRDEDVYLYKDKDADHFDALDIDFEILIASTSLESCWAGMGISNTVGSIAAFANTDLSVFMYETAAPAWQIYLCRGAFVANDVYFCSANTPYYCTLERAAGADTAYLKIYSDSGRESLLDTLEVSGFGTEKWRYAYGFVNYNTTHSGYDFDGYVQNLDLKEAAVYELSCTDGLKVGDTNKGSLVLNLALTDGLKGGDALSKLFEANPSLVDGLKLGEALATLLETSPALTDGIKLCEGTPIDVGEAAINRPSILESGKTVINTGNPANANGTITSIEIWCDSNLGGCKVGIFYTTNGNTLKCRSATTIGDVTSGSKQTFDDLSLSVEAGDYIGIYFSSGNLDQTKTGYSGYWHISGDYCNVNDEAGYDFLASRAVSLFGTRTGAPLAQLEVSLALADGLKLGDSTLAGLFYSLLASDGINLGDSTLYEWICNVVLTDGVKLGDALATQLEANPAITDGIKLSEVLATICQLNVSLTDGVKLSDFADLLGRLLKLITYARPYSDLRVFTRPHSDLKTYSKPHSNLQTYTSEVKQP